MREVEEGLDGHYAVIGSCFLRIMHNLALASIVLFLFVVQLRRKKVRQKFPLQRWSLDREI